MTDNEKRAHDLSIAVSMEICRAKVKSQESSGESVVHVDCFKEYLTVYKEAIRAFDEHFPEGK